MYKKKHLVMAVICTAVLTALISRFCFVQIGGYESGDTVTRARKLIKNYYVNELTDEEIAKLQDEAIHGMVSSLNDPYSRYLNKEDLASYQEDKEESYQGIGVNISFNLETNVLTVATVEDGSPAQKAGILAGDIIAKAGDIEVFDAESYDALRDYIRNGDDETIPLIIHRDGKKMEISVKRETINRHSVTHKMFGDGIGYIYISEFIQSTTKDFAAALDALNNEGMRGLVIDLRGNPGGYADVVLQVTDMLLPKGVIAYLEDNQGKRQYFHSDNTCLNKPITILINQGTASAAELLAGSLKAHELAKIIGEKSYGKAVAQALFPLTEDTAIYLTHARYFTPNGECIDKVGITPDIRVPLALDLIGKISYMEPEEDAQLAKGVEVLLEQLGA